MISAKDFLFPAELQVTKTLVKKCLFVGSCMVLPYLDNFRAARPETVFDYIVFNNIAELPETPPNKVEEYDFQFVQLALREVVTDRLIDFTVFASSEGNDQIVENAFVRLEIMLRTAMKYNIVSGLPTFVANFVVPQIPACAGMENLGTYRDFRYLVQKLNHRLSELVATYKNAHVLDIENISAVIGKRYFLDDIIVFFSHGVFWYPNWSNIEGERIETIPPMSDISPSHIDDFINAVWGHIEYDLRVLRQTDMVKLVVFDLDDTLWRGQIAEHYNDNGNYPVYHGWPLGLAEAVHHLRARGILVAICSKNNMDVVKARWERAAPLGWVKFEDFVLAEIGWGSKAKAVGDIMIKLSLTARSVVFVDDNPVERESVKSAFPEIRVLGSNPLVTRRILLAASETQVPMITTESVNRADMLKKQQDREHERAAISRDEFLAKLACQISFLSLSSSTHPQFRRCFELLNKTNQFNTTGRRWSESEIEVFFRGGGDIVAFEVQDKYTAYGLTGVMLISNRRHFLQFVMSCRVLGLEIETSALKLVISRLLAVTPNIPFTANVAHTELNVVCRDVFERSGFIQSDVGLWSFAVDAGRNIALASHLTVTCQDDFLNANKHVGA